MNGIRNAVIVNIKKKGIDTTGASTNTVVKA
jgi:hypothetical protein